MYKYSDILFCLREEYLKNEEILKKMENYISVNKDDRDVKFHLELDANNENIELYYEALKKRRLLTGILSKMVGVDMTREYGKMAVNNNGLYQPNSKLFTVNEKDKESFVLATEELYKSDLLSDFYNINVHDRDKNINVDRFLDVSPNGTLAIRRNNNDFVTGKYDSVKDEVLFTNSKRKVSYDDMYDILNSEFTIDAFSREMQHLIEDKDIYGLNCYVYDNDDNKVEKRFEPIVEGKRLVLVRK